MNPSVSSPAIADPDAPFLTPIEKPQGLMMKLAYYFTRRQFGKVLTPVKVFSARLPAAFGMFAGKIGQLDKKLELPRETSVDPNTFARVRRFYSERAICEIVWLVASEHFYNMTNIGLNIHSDMLCDLSKRAASSAAGGERRMPAAMTLAEPADRGGRR